jgi:hypothetical protein
LLKKKKSEIVELRPKRIKGWRVGLGSCKSQKLIGKSINGLKYWIWPMWMLKLDWADFDARPFGLVTDLPRRICHVGSDVDRAGQPVTNILVIESTTIHFGRRGLRPFK